MSKLEDLKNETLAMIDEAWHALEGSADVEAARELVHKATADLKAKVEDIAAHLFYHVVGNAEPPAAAPAETPASPVETPTPAAPEGTVPDPAEPATGMAPPAAEPVAATVETTDTAATPEAGV